MNHYLGGKNIYIYQKKKEKANLFTPIEKKKKKNQQIRNRLVKRKKPP